MNAMKRNLIICSAIAAVAAVSCIERHPADFMEISAVYFNNRGQGNVLCDSTEVTFVYEAGDRIEVPVAVQLLGRPAETDRPVDITVISENAAEGTDYILPGDGAAFLPAGETSFYYNVTLLRTDILKSEEKEIRLELHANDFFTLAVTEFAQTTDTVSTLVYRIIFSDMFTEAPAAWDPSILGTFSQAKFELICSVLGIDPGDFNDAAVMTLPRQMYIYNEITSYIEDVLNGDLPYDDRIVDPETGRPVEFPA